MNELLALIAFVAGIPMLLVGYIWLLVASKPFGGVWVLANLFILPVLGLFVIDWHKTWPKLGTPLILTVVGIALIVYTLEAVPQG